MLVIDNKLVRNPKSHFRLNGEPKLKYDNEYDAVIRCYEMNMQDKQKYKIVSYQCPVCHKWHIGNSKKELTSDEKEKIRKKYKTICIKLGKV